jgi:hypothetical protein
VGWQGHRAEGAAALASVAIGGANQSREMASSPLCVLGVGRADSSEKVSTLGLRGHDDEIAIDGNVVTWRAGGCTQKTYTLQPEAGHVIEVSGARFETKRESPADCRCCCRC